MANIYERRSDCDHEGDAMRTFWTIGGLVLAGLCGCEDQVKKSPNAIFHKTTQDVGKFDANAKQDVSDSKVRVTNDPILYPLQAYGPAMEQVAKLGVDQRIATFYAIEGRYPKDHDEFMEKIIRDPDNPVKLPVLPYGDKYQYDVANHTLVVVKGQRDKDQDKDKEAGAAEPVGTKK